LKNNTSKRKRSLARRLLIIEALIIFVFLAFFLACYQKAQEVDPIYANSYYPPLAEYIIGSFVIALASAILVDRLERESEESS